MLSRGAWLDLRPAWATGSDGLFARLVETVPWHGERRQMYERVVDVPRLLSFYGEGEPLPDPLLEQARTDLSRHYAGELGEPFVTAGLCLYRDGRDSVAWHGDTIGRSSTEDTMVAILSLGAPARCCCVRAAAAGRCATSSATATWWSWAARASGPGSTRSPRRRGRSARGSASSSAHAASGSAQSAPGGCGQRTRPAARACGSPRARQPRAVSPSRARQPPCARQPTGPESARPGRPTAGVGRRTRGVSRARRG